MKLTIELNLDRAGFQDGGSEIVAVVLADLCERLPEPLAPTNGQLLMHDEAADYIGFAEISQNGKSDRETLQRARDSVAVRETLRMALARIVQWVDAGCDPSDRSIEAARAALRMDAEAR